METLSRVSLMYLKFARFIESMKIRNHELILSNYHTKLLIISKH